MQCNSAQPKWPVYFLSSFAVVFLVGLATRERMLVTVANASFIGLCVTLAVLWEQRRHRNPEQ